jgi:hypothetical protein
MALLKTNTFLNIKGKYTGTVYKRDKSGLHYTAAKRQVLRQPTLIQIARRSAFRKLLTFITENYTDEFRSCWQQYEGNELQWNQKFISYNLNRVIEGMPIIRYPPGVNIVVNGTFEQGQEPWQLDECWTIANYRAAYHTSAGKFLFQIPDHDFTAGKKYRFSYEIESIHGCNIYAFIETAQGQLYTTPGFKRDIITAVKSGKNGVGLIAWPKNSTGDVVVYNLIID